MSLPEPEPELVHALVPPASFNTLDDDCLGNVLEFVGKSCYSVFGRVNKRCHEMFCLKGLKKETCWYGYAPLHLIQRRGWYYNNELSKGVLHYNRRDILEWMFTDESNRGHRRLKCLCYKVIEESRLDILREVFRRVNEEQLEYLRGCDDAILLCCHAARHGKLECLKFLRENECDWDDQTWYWAKEEGHDHILDYLRDNDYPTEWQNERKYMKQWIGMSNQIPRCTVCNVRDDFPDPNFEKEIAKNQSVVCAIISMGIIYRMTDLVFKYMAFVLGRSSTARRS